MSFEAIEQKSKSVMEACYELERIKMKHASKEDINKQKSFIISLVNAIRKDAQAERE